MSNQDFLKRWDHYKNNIDQNLEKYLQDPKILPLMRESMKYSLMGGGKRLRPILLLVANEICGGSEKIAMPLAAGLEMIHAYSLIHDDLPAIDNDTMRRGRATNHIVFGESTAILAGDSLLNYAYEVMLEGANHCINLPAYIQALTCISQHAGPRALIGGQAADLAHEGDVAAGEKELIFIHTNKTGSLFHAAALAGGLICEANETILSALDCYSNALGVAFQIADDILDVTGGEKLGKTTGKDAAAGKLTFVSVYGLGRAQELSNEKSKEAIDAISFLGEEADFLRDMAVMVVERDH